MTLNLRLLLGLTNFTSFLYASHLSSMGPAGILASSVMLMSVTQPPLPNHAGEYRNGERDVAHGDQCGEPDGKPASPFVESGAVPPHRLEQAPGTVVQVHAEGDVGDDVQDRHGNPRERGDDVAVDVAAHIAGIRPAPREV